MEKLMEAIAAEIAAYLESEVARRLEGRAAVSKKSLEKLEKLLDQIDDEISSLERWQSNVTFPSADESLRDVADALDNLEEPDFDGLRSAYTEADELLGRIVKDIKENGDLP